MTIQRMRDAATQLDKSNEGYDQNQRWTFYVDGEVIKGKESDCSSICGAIAHMAGYPVDLSDPFYTGTFAERLEAAGFDVFEFTDLDDLRDGDFVVTPGAHVEFVMDGGSNGRMFSARQDESGGATGGAAGDQTGSETGFKASFNRSGGWDWIVRPRNTEPVDVDFRFGQANLQAERFGGLDDSSPKRGQFLDAEMGCSVYALSEVSEEARYAIRDSMGGQDQWKVYECNYVCVMWDSHKWKYHNTESVSFGTAYHGAVRAELTNNSNGEQLDVIAIHVRPNDAISGDDLAEKLEDVTRGLELYRPGIPTIYAGDFSTKEAETVIIPAGFIRVTPNVDTMPDTEGSQAVDAIFITPDLGNRAHSKVNGGTVTDHDCWVYNGTVIAADTPDPCA